MKLRKLELLAFKNIESTSNLFADKFNCFLGDNGMGKTNLIDAIHYLSMLKSHIGNTDKECILNDRPESILWGTYVPDRVEKNQEAEEEWAVSLKISQTQHKKLHINGKNYPKISEHIGKIPIVIISPQDQKVIRGNSEERRRFIDRLLSQKDPIYLQTLIQYNRVLSQRNSLLKQGNFDSGLMDFIEEQLARYGVVIQEKRETFLIDFIPLFEKIYHHISGGSEPISLCYQPTINPPIKDEYKRILQQNRPKDQILGYSSMGVHRDDLEMKVCNRLVRKSGSEGQNKTFLVALKMAEFDFLLESNLNNKPILLLDDLFDKLDAHRVEHIVKWVSGDHFGQIFITDTNRKYIDEIIQRQNTDFRLFSVTNGRVDLIESTPEK